MRTTENVVTIHDDDDWLRNPKSAATAKEIKVLTVLICIDILFFLILFFGYLSLNLYVYTKNELLRFPWKWRFLWLRRVQRRIKYLSYNIFRYSFNLYKVHHIVLNLIYNHGQKKNFNFLCDD